jgi:hypothetical protein
MPQRFCFDAIVARGTYGSTYNAKFNDTKQCQCDCNMDGEKAGSLYVAASTKRKFPELAGII